MGWASRPHKKCNLDVEQLTIATLVELIGNSPNENIRKQASESLGKIDKDNPVAIAALVELIGNSPNKNIPWLAADSLWKIMKGKHFATAVSGLKNCLTSEIYENDFNRYTICYLVIWDCAQNMAYQEFHQTWHAQPTNSPTPDNHRQNTDIPTLLKQLQPTDKTFPVPLNIRALEGETDTSAIAQELCTQLYSTFQVSEVHNRGRDTAVPCPYGNRRAIGVYFINVESAVSSNHPRRYRHSRNSQRLRIQAINSPTQKSPAKTAHRLNFALLSLRRCAFIFHPQTRRHSHGNSCRLDYRYTAGIALNRFSGGWR